MTKLEYKNERMSDKMLREDLFKVVPDVDALISQSENEFSDIQKFGLYPADQCVPFVLNMERRFINLTICPWCLKEIQQTIYDMVVLYSAKLKYYIIWQERIMPKRITG